MICWRVEVLLQCCCSAGAVLLLMLASGMGQASDELVDASLWSYGPGLYHPLNCFLAMRNSWESGSGEDLKWI